MNIKSLVVLLAVLPVATFAATRGDASRVGMRASMSTVSPAQKVIGVNKNKVTPVASAPKVAVVEVDETPVDAALDDEEKVAVVLDNTECRAAYRECMDDFCLLDESEGERCSCSDNIKQSKTLIQEIQKIQSEAELLYTEGVEREK